MTDRKTCFFIGHREVPSELAPILAKEVEHHIVEYGVSSFIVGMYGNFDHMAAGAVIAAKVKHPQIRLSLLLPYHPVERKIVKPDGIDELYYQPHARFVDEPAEPEKNLATVQETKATPESQKISLPTQPPVKLETKQVHKNTTVKSTITTRMPNNMKATSSTHRIARRGKYFDIARVPRRKKAIVAKPLAEVFSKPRQKKPLPANPAKKTQNPKPTRPMPGDIRLMKNNIVVIGPLQEAPQKTSDLYPRKSNKRDMMPRMKDAAACTQPAPNLHPTEPDRA